MSNSTPFAVWVRRTQNHAEYCAYPSMQSECSMVRRNERINENSNKRIVRKIIKTKSWWGLAADNLSRPIFTKRAPLLV